MPAKKSDTESDDQPQLKDQDLYERLREEGNSKEKSARISNAAANKGREQIGEKGGKSGSYEDWTVDELTDRAKELGLEGCSKLKKDDLINALRNH
ncbi:Rho termination factor N-terminal domain-containing protein [Rhodococcus sp. G-MC3]|uniref:DUF7218 family protein n=1 Tax=Rhodococcus sp. G-MC3 TaxID=3046209 RepID=UPI0024B96C94|nr:Rho termination factor N-terminal domain-containing protein [Rhodococcus sp. G-MC3]MDJ0396123.1 Rho termination factor N-terminal domain-containing protein [Rhodococcus sp. G-MC3]